MSNTTQDRSEGRSIGPEISRRGIIKTAGVAAGAATVGTSAVSPASAGWFDDAIDAAVESQKLLLFGPGALFVDGVFQSDNTNQAEANAISAEAEQSFAQFNNRIKNIGGINENTVTVGRDAIFRDAKIAGVGAIKDGKTKAEVETEAISTAKSYWETFEKNLFNVLKAGDDTIRSFNNQINDTNGVSLSDVYDQEHISSGTNSPRFTYNGITGTKTVTTPVAGIEYTVNIHELIDVDNGDLQLDTSTLFEPHNSENLWRSSKWEQNYPLSVNGQRLMPPQWINRRDELQNLWDDGAGGGLKNEITTWVGDAFDAVAAGEIAAGDLLTATELSETIAEETPNELATAHLRLSNAPTDAGTRAEVEIEQPNGAITLSDAILASTADGFSLSPGETNDPANLSGDVIVNYRPLNGSFLASADTYQTTVDGGVVTLTNGPQGLAGGDPSLEGLYKYLGKEVVASITTTAGETVSVQLSEFTYDDNLSWTVDLSPELETPITEVEKIEYFPTENEATTQSLNRYVESTFTVNEVVDADTGDQLDTVNFERQQEPQTASNYLSAEEIQQLLDEQQDVREEIRVNNSGGVFGGFGGISNLNDLPTLPGFNALESAAIAVIAFLGLDILTS